MSGDEVRALILSASLGGGHLKAAEAVEQALTDLIPGFNALHVDYLSYLSRLQRGISADFYLWLLRHSPAIYRHFYHWSNRKTAPKAITTGFGIAGLSKMVRDLRRTSPQLVLSSYTAPATLAHAARTRLGMNFLNVLMVTDYNAHYHWARREADLLLVATEAVKQDLLKWGVAAEKIKVTGIPILSRYTELVGADKQALRARFGLEPYEPVVLVSAGGMGSLYSGEQDIVDACSRLGFRVQVLLLAGAGSVGTETVGSATVHRLGYTTLFPELLAASDLVVGKAGGLTVAEATALGVPMLIYKPIPGQEEENARYLEKMGAAMWSPSAWSIRRDLLALLGNPAQQAAMSEASRAIGRPYAAHDAAKIILEHLQQTGLQL